MTTDPATAEPDTPRRTPTLRDVAAAAGVSKASASRALDPNSQYVSQEIRSRVAEAAARLGYRPNASARATTTGSTAMIAVLVADIRDPANAEIVHGVVEAANRAGMVATFAGTEHAIDDEIRAIRMIRGLRPHAIVLTGTHGGTAASRAGLRTELERYAADVGRVVIAGDDELPFDTALVPRRRGAIALVEALAGLGYRAPVLIRPEYESRAVREWEDGIAEGVRRCGMRFADAPIRAAMSRDGGYKAAATLLERATDDLDLVLAAADAMAIGAMSAMRDAGVRPGADIGVAGFDDAIGAEDVTPELTSVDIALSRAGAAAVELALLPPGEDRRIVEFEPRVRLRGTTPPRD